MYGKGRMVRKKKGMARKVKNKKMIKQFDMLRFAPSKPLFQNFPREDPLPRFG